MSRRVLAILIALVVLPLPATALAQSSADAVAADINAYWAAQFANAGVEYTPPAIATVDGPVETPCGTIGPWIGPGAYCAGNATVYVVSGWFDPSSAYGSFALDTVLAHEWGHHIQLLLGITGLSKQIELQADCAAGAYLANAEARGLVTSGMLTQSVGLAATAGDLSFLPTDGVEHGSGAERGISLMNGYNGGPAGCGFPL